jgi:hypothetical protein
MEGFAVKYVIEISYICKKAVKANVMTKIINFFVVLKR